MATVYGGDTGPDISYPTIADKVFSSEQSVIPFLGAGASVAGATVASVRKRALAPLYPDESAIREVCERLGFSGSAKAYLEQSIKTASELQAYEVSPLDTWADAVEKPYPVSALELATALAAKATYRGTWPFTLLHVASYHEFVAGREHHCRRLNDLFENKNTPLPTHDLVGRAARRAVNDLQGKHYLVITTNYDSLVETTLEKSYQLPYCILTVDRNDRMVDIVFSERVQSWLELPDRKYAEFVREHQKKYPENFTFVWTQKPLAVVYKIHGTLQPVGEGRDSIVISDEDYITFLKRQGETGARMIPAGINRLLQGKRFLFLGYSFSDWNIRGLYDTAVLQRGKSTGDYAVLNRLDAYESRYFSQRTIDILLADLVDFVNRIKENEPRG